MQRLVVEQLGIEAARSEAQKKVLDVKFVPKGSTSLGKPKFGKEDPENQPHTGGNTWAGGVRASLLSSERDFSFADRLADAILRGLEVEEGICVCIKEET